MKVHIYSIKEGFCDQNFAKESKLTLEEQNKREKEERQNEKKKAKRERN